MRNKGGKLISGLSVCIVIEIMIVVCVALANHYPAPLCYFFFYNVLYGIVFSFLLPLCLLRKEEKQLNFITVRPFGKRQIVVLLIFVVVSTGGQLVPAAMAGGPIPWHLLPEGVAPLIMTTFFEEFFFQGFVQNRFEKRFGALPAILISGLMFSLYHIGYPGFRTFGNILLLFAVGVGFAAAYTLSGHNLIVAYFVNLPNAFITYVLKFEQFPTIKMPSVIASIITSCIIAAVLIMLGISAKAGSKNIASHDKDMEE